MLVSYYPIERMVWEVTIVHVLNFEVDKLVVLAIVHHIPKRYIDRELLWDQFVYFKKNEKCV